MFPQTNEFANHDRPRARPPFLAEQRLSLLTGAEDVLRCLDVEAFRPQRDQGGFRGDEHGKDSPWQPLERDTWLEGIHPDGKFRRCVVVADAGLGKSTNLDWLNAALAQQQRRCLAFCLSIERLPASPAGLFDVLVDECWRLAAGCGDHGTLTAAAAKNLLQRYFQTGRLVLLLDSLDQTADNSTAELTLQKLLTRAEWAACPILFSTRPHALSTRWHRLFKPHETAWQFVRIEQLDREQQARLLGSIVDERGTVSRYELIPVEARGSLGVPRVCETFRRLEQRDQFADLKTFADVTWKATTEMLLEGLKACAAGNKLGWNPSRGEVPPAYRPIQRDIAFHLLAALAFQMFVNPDARNEPGAAPNLEHVPEAATETLLVGVLTRMQETKARLQVERRLPDAVLLGSVEPPDFFLHFDAICAMNAGPLENYLLDHLGRHKELRWRNPTLQAFFAAAWACRFASSEDLAVIRRWVVDATEKNSAVYAEFWRFASEMKTEALHLPTWVNLMRPLYDGSLRDRQGRPIRSAEFIYRGWDRMETTETGKQILGAFLNEFQNLRTNSTAEKMLANFVPVAGGTFSMGSPKEEEDRSNDEFQHPVTLSPFRMHAFAVTNAQYELFDPAHKNERWGSELHPAGEEARDHPVVSVTWFQAWCFARWTGNSLPTEAQWEYACREGACSYRIFHYGNSLSSAQANFDGNYPYGGAKKGPYLERTRKVGSYQPNGFGLYDMHGNVDEWCADWYAADFYQSEKGQRKDPLNDVAASARVLRGGGWSDYGWYCRSAFRSRLVPGIRFLIIGFRLAAVPGVGAESGEQGSVAEAT